jgi:hypothetical protein
MSAATIVTAVAVHSAMESMETVYWLEGVRHLLKKVTVPFQRAWAT